MILRRLFRLRARRQLGKSCPRPVLRDWCDEFVYAREEMFKRMKIGMVVVVVCIDFPYVGRVEEFDESSVTLAGAVKILWDGRHGEFAAGRPPSAAEIEATHNPYTISADAIIGWGPYSGGKIPEPQ